MNQKNLVLIGMSGSGKRTVGPLLADRLSRPFVDTDRRIESIEGRPLRARFDINSPDGFHPLEEAHVASLEVSGAIVATGGSVVYEERAMERLHRDGVLLYLYAPLSLLEMRISDMVSRAELHRPSQTLRDICEERDPLYRAHADLIVDTFGLRPLDIVEDVLPQLRRMGFLDHVQG